MNKRSGLISIKVVDLKKVLGRTLALSGVSLFFEAAKLHGIIGPEGAGKTTLLRTLIGLYAPTAGQVEFILNNEPVPFSQVREKIAYMPQQPSLYPDLTIGEHLEFFKELYQIPDTEYQRIRTELLEVTRLDPFVDRPAGKLSGGMYKKLGLMCALLRSPEIIILDEPTNGVDPISRREFWDLLYRLLEQKILILVSTAYMDEAMRSQVVHLIDNGSKIGEGEPQTLLSQEGVNSFDELFLKLGNDQEARSQEEIHS